jgi:hypothetical protein
MLVPNENVGIEDFSHFWPYLNDADILYKQSRETYFLLFRP